MMWVVRLTAVYDRHQHGHTYVYLQCYEKIINVITNMHTLLNIILEKALHIH